MSAPESGISMKDVFSRAMRLPAAEREAHVAAAYPDEPEVRAKVMRLLGAHARSGSFLEPPLAARGLGSQLLRSQMRSSREPGPGPAPRGGRREDLIAGRYRLAGRIGSGSSGVVHRALDLLSGEAVALKLLRWQRGLDSGLARREVAALRFLRLPGVVTMSDEGEDGDQAFIVMDLVNGQPFPGLGTPCRWSEVSDSAIALLETLDRIHGAGYIHGDLKPANILVTADRRPVVLDLGLTRRDSADEGPGNFGGTPAYLAPEQLLGQSGTPQSDLYSVGVMLYEALSGRSPHPAGSLIELLSSRPSRPPVPLAKAARDCPPHVASIVDRLLAIPENARPPGAAAALGLLGHESRCYERLRKLPRMGGDDVVRRLLQAVGDGRSEDVFGPRGSGRTRCLSDLVEALRDRGREVLRLEPGERSLGCFRPIMDAEDDTLASVDEASGVILERLRGRLESGHVLVVDDADDLDPWSIRLLEQARAFGPVIRARTGHSDEAPCLAPLSESDLRGVFAGPDRIFHLREDAAHELRIRTGGLPRAMTEELSTWIRSQVAVENDEGLEVSRTDIEWLRATRRVGLTSPLPERSRSLETACPDERTLVACVVAAGGRARLPLLARIADRPVWEVDTLVRQLTENDVLHVRSDGTIQAKISIAPAACLDLEARRRIHRRLAEEIPEGEEGRLYHLVAGDLLEAVPGDSLTRARRLRDEGRVGLGFAVLLEGLSLLRGKTEGISEIPILEELFLCALALGTVPALDRTLYAIESSRDFGPALMGLENLARAAVVVLQGAWERGLRLANTVKPYRDHRLELARQSVRVLAARRGSRKIESEVLAEVATWAETARRPEIDRAMSAWLGWRSYGEGDFVEAAARHRRAAELSDAVPEKATSLLTAASALMEARSLGEARVSASNALVLAREGRHPALEARAYWILRSVDYRDGREMTADRELVDIVGRLGVAHLEASIALTEGAVAWRAEDLSTARALAGKASRRWTGSGRPQLGALARALALAAGAEFEPQEMDSLAQSGIDGPFPGIGVQILGLLAHRCPESSPVRLEQGRRLASKRPREERGARREVLSLEEALELLSGGGIR